MTYEEWRDMTRLMLDFDSLSDMQKESILLMIDGLKYRTNPAPMSRIAKDGK